MSDLLGGFSSSFQANDNEEIDFDLAASAYPDINLDGTTEIPTAPAGRSNSGFSFDDFDDHNLDKRDSTVRVTGDDEIDKFESEFPDIGAPQVCRLCS